MNTTLGQLCALAQCIPFAAAAPSPALRAAGVATSYRPPLPSPQNLRESSGSRPWNSEELSALRGGGKKSKKKRSSAKSLRKRRKPYKKSKSTKRKKN